MTTAPEYLNEAEAILTDPPALNVTKRGPTITPATARKAKRKRAKSARRTNRKANRG